MHPRHPDLSTLFNFRDLGGHPGDDGRTVRRGLLFRSDSLHRLTAPEGRYLATLGIRTVIDLRRPKEINTLGRVPAHLDVEYFNIPPEHREWDPEEVCGTDTHRYLADRYLDMAQEGRDGFGSALRLIAQPQRLPLVMHCFAGKDRTGVLAALVLATLGVPDDAIVADYSYSEHAQPHLARDLAGANPPVPTHFLASPPQAMLLFLAELRDRHGSVDGYLRFAGVRPEHITSLRSQLLEQRPR